MSSWDEFDDAPVEQVQSRRSPRPILDLRDPTKAAGDARDEVRTDIAVRGEGRDVDKTSFDQRGVLYERYSKLPEVKNYRVAVQELAKAIGTGEGPQADLALTYAFAKAMDPESVVRESEQAMVAGSQPVLQAAVENVKKQFAMDGAGTYTPEARRQIRAQIANSVAQRNGLYNQQRKYFTEIANRNNFDPYEIIGDHDANPFAEKIRAWGKEGKGQRPIETVNGFAKGTDVQLAGGGNDGGPDRGAILAAMGLDEQKESVLMAALNQHSGNPNATMEDVIAAYEEAGAGLPSPAGLKRAMQDMRRGARFGGVDTSTQEAAYKAKVDALAAEKDNFGGGVESLIGGGVRGAGLGFADEIGAGLTTVLSGGNYSDNLEAERINRDADRQANPYAAYGGEIAGSAAVPFSAARTPAQLAKVGAVTGGIYGVGESDGDFGDRVIGGMQGAGVGAAGGAILGKIADVAAPYVARGAESVSKYMGSKTTPDLPTVDAARIAQAGLDEGVSVNRAMIAPELSNKITAVESSLSGGPVIRGGMQRVSEGIERRTGELSKGTALDPYIAGEKVQGAVMRADKAMKSETDRLYDMYRKASGDPPVKPENALSKIDDELSELAKSPKTNIGEIRYLNDLKSDLSRGDMTVDTLLGLRRSMRGQISERNLGMTQADARVQRVLEAAGDDIAKALNPESSAYKILQRANKAHGERQVFKRQLIKELIGTDRDIPLDPDKAFAKIQQWAKPGADGNRLIATWRKLDAEEAADISGTVAEALGRDKAGVFSPTLFVSQVEKLSPRARVTMFGPDGKASIDNLIELSNQYKRVQGTFNNSKSGVAFNSSNAKQAALTVLGTSGGGLAGGWTGAAIGAGLAGMIMAKNMVTARTLMSPNISKWIAGLSKKPNQPAALAHIARLDSIAKANPVIANEVLQLQSTLRDAFATYPERLAAHEPKQGQGAQVQANQKTVPLPR